MALCLKNYQKKSQLLKFIYTVIPVKRGALKKAHIFC